MTDYNPIGDVIAFKVGLELVKRMREEGEDPIDQLMRIDHGVAMKANELAQVTVFSLTQSRSVRANIQGYSRPPAVLARPQPDNTKPESVTPRTT